MVWSDMKLKITLKMPHYNGSGEFLQQGNKKEI